MEEERIRRANEDDDDDDEEDDDDYGSGSKGTRRPKRGPDSKRWDPQSDSLNATTRGDPKNLTG